MSFHKPPVGLPEDAKMRGSPRKDQDLRGAAILHQQRRLKQATQFVHKDSADLLPLDQLRRLGTSKDLVSKLERKGGDKGTAFGFMQQVG